MKIKRAFLAAVLVWVIGVSVYSASYFVHILADPELQANILLTLAVIPASLLGAFIYYKNGQQTHGLRLGAFMFATAMVLDAIITVPLFIMPLGGTHFTFFMDLGFWLIALLYIGMVALYWKLKVAEAKPRATNPV